MIASGMLYAAQTVQHRLLVTRNLRGKFGKRGKLLLGADLKQQLQPQKFSIEIAGKAEQRRFGNRLRQLMDIRIFVETDADVRILRRALRDVEERGRSMQSIVQQYLTTVKPMHEQFVEPTRKYADIVVLEGGHNLVALDLIMQRIAGHIAENPPEDAT